MKQSRRPLRIYIASLWAVGAAVFAWALPISPQAGLLDLGIFLTLAALSEWWYVSTSKESGMSLSFTVHFAAAVLFGPAFAMLIAVCGLLITDGLIRHVPHVRTAFNVPQMAISVGVCGVLYEALKAPGPLDFVADAPALALAALAYLVVNDTLVAGVLGLTGRSFFQEWRLSARDIMLPYVSMAPLGALVAYTYQATPWALVLFLPLILVIYNGFKLFVSLQRETDDALVALADSIDRRDHYTYQHSMHVAEYVDLIAHELKLPPREIDLIVAAARVHDLGKIGTDNRVLLKPSSLTAEERDTIQQHVIDGAELAGKFSMFNRGRLFIRHHHERWDGTGYPDGLAAEAIPLGARLIGVADAYESMTSDRPYRKALSPDEAIAELRYCAGTQFDPRVVQALAQALASQGIETSAAPAISEQIQPWQPKDIVTELAHGRDQAQLWAAAVLTLTQALDVPNCDLYQRDASGELTCVAGLREGAWFAEFLGHAPVTGGRAIDREAVTSRAPVLVSTPKDARLSEAERDEMARWRATSKAIVPMIVRERIVGLADMSETRDGRQISVDQAAAAFSLCQLIATAVLDAKVIEDQRAQARRLATLLESSRAVASAKGSDEALAVIARKALELFDITCCVAAEYDWDLDALVPRAIAGHTNASCASLGEPLRLSERPDEGNVLASGVARLACVSDPDLDPAKRSRMEVWNEKSCLTVPMTSADGAKGLLTLWDARRERHYNAEELALASSLAELAGETVRGAARLRRLQGLSETDSLTGLANRRKIHDLLLATHAQAERYGSRFSIAMLDVDSFKHLNDTHGHPAGDAALRQIARLLKEQTRAADFVGRYGGDEFLLVLPETSPAEAIAQGENLRAALAMRPYVTVAGEIIPIHVSIGVAGYPETAGGPEDVIAAADAGLYAAKRCGGDAVTAAAAIETASDTAA